MWHGTLPTMAPVCLAAMAALLLVALSSGAAVAPQANGVAAGTAASARGAPNIAHAKDTLHATVSGHSDRHKRLAAAARAWLGTTAEANRALLTALHEYGWEPPSPEQITHGAGPWLRGVSQVALETAFRTARALVLRMAAVPASTERIPEPYPTSGTVPTTQSRPQSPGNASFTSSKGGTLTHTTPGGEGRLTTRRGDAKTRAARDTRRGKHVFANEAPGNALQHTRAAPEKSRRIRRGAAANMTREMHAGFDEVRGDGGCYEIMPGCAVCATFEPRKQDSDNMANGTVKNAAQAGRALASVPSPSPLCLDCRPGYERVHENGQLACVSVGDREPIIRNNVTLLAADVASENQRERTRRSTRYISSIYGCRTPATYCPHPTAACWAPVEQRFWSCIIAYGMANGITWL